MYFWESNWFVWMLFGWTKPCRGDTCLFAGAWMEGNGRWLVHDGEFCNWFGMQFWSCNISYIYFLFLCRTHVLLLQQTLGLYRSSARRLAEKKEGYTAKRFSMPSDKQKGCVLLKWVKLICVTEKIWRR